MSTIKRSGGDEGSSGSCIKKLRQEIDDITECAICKETLSNARMLSCCHFFCIDCLKKYCENKTNGDDISCPVCRRQSEIPSGGVDKFPLCHFINKLIDVNKLTDKNSNQSKDGCCSPCLAIGRRETAAGYCFECREDLCEPCVQRHKVMNSLKSHKIVDLDSKPEAKELLKSAVSFCQEHPDQIIHFYCNDCKKVACIACNMVDHKKHNYSKIKDSYKQVSAILDNQCNRVRNYVHETENILRCVGDTRNDCQNNIALHQAFVTGLYQKRKTMLDMQYNKLMCDLSVQKFSCEAKLDLLKEEVESELVCMKSFEKYWSELKECGSACDVVQAANSLQDTAEKLVSQHVEKQKERMDKTKPEQYRIYVAHGDLPLTGEFNFLGTIRNFNEAESDSDSSDDSSSSSDQEEEQDHQVASRRRGFLSSSSEDDTSPLLFSRSGFQSGHDFTPRSRLLSSSSESSTDSLPLFETRPFTQAIESMRSTVSILPIAVTRPNSIVSGPVAKPIPSSTVSQPVARSSRAASSAKCSNMQGRQAASSKRK